MRGPSTPQSLLRLWLALVILILGWLWSASESRGNVVWYQPFDPSVALVEIEAKDASGAIYGFQVPISDATRIVFHGEAAERFMVDGLGWEWDTRSRVQDTHGQWSSWGAWQTACRRADLTRDGVTGIPDWLARVPMDLPVSWYYGWWARGHFGERCPAL